MTIRLKIICIVGAVVIATSCSLALTFGFLLKNNLEDIAKRQTSEGAWQLRQQLDQLLDLGIPMDQILGFEEQCRALLERNSDLAYAYVTDRDGRILFHNDSSQAGSFPNPDAVTAATTANGATTARVSHADNDYIESVLPVKHGQNRVGSIHVGIGFDNVHEKLVEAFIIPVGIFFLLLVGSVALSYALFQKFVGGPLMILTREIDLFGQNPEGAARLLELPGNDEFGTIASSFSDMASNVEANIARRKQAEADLVTLNKDLELRIAKRTEELAESAAAALAATQAKSSFLSHMSHELRTPLNSIIGYGEAMQHRIKGELPEAYREYADVIVKSGNLLLQTVNTVLDLAKIEAGRLELFPSPVSVAPVLEDALTVMEIQAQERGISLRNKSTLLPHLHVDELRVKQTFVNILGNAVKFTQHGSITVEDAFDSQGGYAVTVTDTGIGMSEDEVRIALEPFAQVHGNSFSRRFHGTGLGLSFSREIMQLHGGDLVIRSARGQGTAVTLHFPPKVLFADTMDGGPPITRNRACG